MPTTDPKRSKPGFKNNGSSYAYYTGLGFQMIATIGIFAFIGYKIDTSKGKEPGLYTAVLSLVGVFVSLISTIRSVMNKK